MELQTELNVLAEAVREKAPPDVWSTMEATIEKIRASGLEQLALQPWKTMPDFELPDATGKMVKSVDLRAHGPLLIVFYRGEWCPFCNLALRGMQEWHSEFIQRGVTLVAISPQTPEHSLSMREKNQLQFPVLSDSGNRVARQFGIVYTLDEALKPILETFGTDIPAHNGDNSFELPFPATYLVDRHGMILHSFVEVDYRKRLAPEIAISWIEQM